ncbi:HAD-IA family hydrolase [Acidisoma cellulosilytica]|uniref:HAD-IA family hydrolase n=1 Tax=Acidisoma cellulosilyticum TaxID=2802395 RepID=A0A963Z0T4_9PROT|nr:HAD-IA family hydrolase [Acidisoma cellulosilyticum]MCB8879755.1 HAD-IA family hydrolase [Acidisoma cellulosilyticum]
MRFEKGRTLTARGFLFDMDGTLVDSGPVVERVWGKWADEQGLDFAGLMPVAHGRRAIETIAMFGKTVLDIEAEARRLEEAERLDIDGLSEIAGARALIAALPADRWAIVTSADDSLARTRLGACGFPIPKVFITAESVEQGKPNPRCYQLGAEGIGFDPKDCFVFEDADAGLAAGRAAGAQVIAVASTQSADNLDRKGELWIPDMAGLRVVLDGEWIHLTHD